MMPIVEKTDGGSSTSNWLGTTGCPKKVVFRKIDIYKYSCLLEVLWGSKYILIYLITLANDPAMGFKLVSAINPSLNQKDTHESHKQFIT